MKLHSLTSLKERDRQRIGRGGKRGTTSGRGQKGQKSRSGHRIRPAERDLILKLPKMRGFRNKAKADAAEVFNIGEVGKKMTALAKGGSPVEFDLAALKAAGMIGKKYNGMVKILGNGEITIAIRVKGMQVSAGAKAKIEKAGGKVE